MKFGTLRKVLLNEIADRLNSRDFVSPEANELFSKLYPWGRAVILIHFVKHKGDFDVTARVAIRIDAIEHLVQRTNHRASEELKRTMCTLGADIGVIRDGRQMRWTISSESDITEVADGIAESVDSIALPFIESSHDLEDAFSCLTSDDRAMVVRRPPLLEGAKKAIAAAVVLGKDKAWIREFARQKITESRGRPQTDLPGFMAFLDSLGDPEIIPDNFNGIP